MSLTVLKVGKFKTKLPAWLSSTETLFLVRSVISQCPHVVGVRDLLKSLVRIDIPFMKAPPYSHDLVDPKRPQLLTSSTLGGLNM